MPRKPHEIRATLNSFAKSAVVSADDKKITGIRGALVNQMEQTLDSRQRKLALCWLFGTSPVHQMSMSELTTPQVLALKNWVDWLKMGEDYIPNPDFETEVRWVAWEAEAQFNKDHAILQEGLFPGGLVDVAVNEFGGEIVNKISEKRIITEDYFD
jgi:hypothetical protein